MIWKVAGEIKDLNYIKGNLKDKISKSMTLNSRSYGEKGAE